MITEVSLSGFGILRAPGRKVYGSHDFQASGDFSFVPASVRRLFDMLILELFGWRCLLGIGVSSFIHKALLGRLQTPADFIPCTARHLPSSFVKVNFLT